MLVTNGFANESNAIVSPTLIVERSNVLYDVPANLTSLPDVPELPAVPEVPVVPDVPELPAVPLVPLVAPRTFNAYDAVIEYDAVIGGGKIVDPTKCPSLSVCKTKLLPLTYTSFQTVPSSERWTL